MPTLARMLKIIKENGGFIRDIDLKYLVYHDPHRICLVRCNLGRFTCEACEVAKKVDEINKKDDDWVRDVSLPTTDPIWK